MLLINGGGAGSGGGLLATRRGTIAAAVGVALVAGLVLLLFLQQYRSSVADEGAAARVLVADGLIAQGSAGDTLASRRMFRIEEVRKSQLRPGAITDPAALRGKLVARDVVPGQQLTAADLQVAGGDIRTQLSGDQRALAIPADAVRTLNGTLRPGDRVDMLVGVNADDKGVGRAIVRQMLSDVLVLSTPGAAAPGQPSGSGGEAITVRVGGEDVSRVAYAAVHAQIWVVIRPGAGAKELPVTSATLDRVLAGRKPVAMEDGR